MQGACARTTRNTCWKCERMVVGQKGLLPGSWNTMVTMSLPMWRFRRSWGLDGKGCERAPQVPPHSGRAEPGHQWLPHPPLDKAWGAKSWERHQQGELLGVNRPEGKAQILPPTQQPSLLPQKALATPRPPAPSHLLLVIGGVRQHRGHVEHDLVVLVCGVEGVRARGIRCGQGVGDTEGDQGESGWLELAILAGSLEPLCPQPASGQPLPARRSKGFSLAVPLPLPPQAPASSLGVGGH